MVKDLVIFRAGERSLHSFWRDVEAAPSWDLYLCPYQPIPAAPAAPGVIVGEVIHGPKFSGLRTLLQAWPGWRDYRYIMLADDDLLMSQTVVAAFFANCARLGAKLAQPALTEQSFAGHIVVLQNSAFKARAVSFVEIMLPCFRTDVLQELLWTLDLTETGWGWGLDALWPKLLGYEGLFIVDTNPVFHTRPVGRMRDLELERRVQLETADILKRYDCGFIRKTLGGLTMDGRTLDAASPNLLYTLLRGYDGIFQRRPELVLPFIEQQTGALRDTDSPPWMRR
jgi:hypothetical protein